MKLNIQYGRLEMSPENSKERKLCNELIETLNPERVQSWYGDTEFPEDWENGEPKEDCNWEGYKFSMKNN
jgi:hypothetical protein